MVKSHDKKTILTSNINHLAIILDGNRRWAKARGLSSTQGHLAGAKNVVKIIGEVLNYQITELSLYAFSVDNWKRSPDEINFIFKQFESYLLSYRSKFNKYGIRVCVIGSKQKITKPLLKLIKLVETETNSNTNLKLNLMFNYGGNVDLAAGLKNSNDYLSFRKKILSHNVSDVDLLIRTGGDLRISNFLPIQLAYAELYFTKLNWPEFDKLALKKAIKDFQTRTRRFGGD